MKTKVFTCFILIVFLMEGLYAQDSVRKKISYFNQTELGVFFYHNLAEPSSGSGRGLRLQTVNGILIFRHFAVGPGIGIISSSQGSAVLFMHAQYQFKLKRVIPFVFGDGGSSLGGHTEVSEHEPGPMFAVGGGILSKARFHFTTTISYNYVENSYHHYCHFCGWQDFTDNGVSVMIGFGF